MKIPTILQIIKVHSPTLVYRDGCESYKTATLRPMGTTCRQGVWTQQKSLDTCDTEWPPSLLTFRGEGHGLDVLALT